MRTSLVAGAEPLPRARVEAAVEAIREIEQAHARGAATKGTTKMDDDAKKIVQGLLDLLITAGAALTDDDPDAAMAAIRKGIVAAHAAIGDGAGGAETATSRKAAKRTAILASVRREVREAMGLYDQQKPGRDHGVYVLPSMTPTEARARAAARAAGVLPFPPRSAA